MTNLIIILAYIFLWVHFWQKYFSLLYSLLGRCRSCMAILWCYKILHQLLFFTRTISPLEKPNEDWCDEIWTHNGVPDLIFRHPDEGEDVIHLGELLEEDGEAVPLADDRDAEVNNKVAVSLDFNSRPAYVSLPIKWVIISKNKCTMLLVDKFIHQTIPCFVFLNSSKVLHYLQRIIFFIFPAIYENND